MPVTRFSEFVNVADLMAMDRAIADVSNPISASISACLREIAGQILSESLSDSLRVQTFHSPAG
jgi:hypothetical protein